MDRTVEFQQLLERAVLDGVITQRQADDLFRRFLNGEIDPVDIPLPPEQMGGAISDKDIAFTLALIALLDISLSSVRLNEEHKIVDALQRWWQDKAWDLATGYRRGNLTLEEFQRESARLLRQLYLAAAYTAQDVEELPPELLRRIQDMIRLEEAYLSRFADAIAINQIVGQEPTADYLGIRLGLYGAGARSIFYQIVESQRLLDAFGWVAQYIPLDDPNTCGPCSEAAGFYLPGSGPYPGDVCLGRGLCRCRRVLQYRPDIYAELTGGV